MLIIVVLSRSSVRPCLRRCGTMIVFLRRTDVYLKVTAAMIVISHLVMTDAIMSIVDIVAIPIMEMSAIITDVIKMSTIMTAAI